MGYFLFLNNAHAELATAVLLIVEIIFVEQLVATILKSTLAPILCPEDGAWNSCLGAQTSLRDLLKTLPTGRGECGGEILQAQCFGLQGGNLQPIGEALETTTASLRFTLQSTNSLEPALMVIVAINPLES